jgi:type II secretory pathway component PulF
MNEFVNMGKVVLWVLLTASYFVVPVLLFYGVYLLVSLPLRRRERARLFLDVLELGIKDGQSPERAVVAAASSRDGILGVRFYTVASHIEAGERLDGALRKVPRMLPPEISAMLQVGSEIGAVSRVLPACRQLLNDVVSQTRGALNYLPVLAFIIMPVVPVVFLMISIMVLPKFEQIGADMLVAMPASSHKLFQVRYWLVLFEFLVMFFFQVLIFFYIAGPRGRTIASLGLESLGRAVDLIMWSLPWRRNRMKRNFASMLALLLDAGVSEARAVTLAAESTANSVFVSRARNAAAQLADGAKLPDALETLDDSRELRWRIDNATHGESGFFASLKGWFDSLDAKAFQQEQGAAQLLTTTLVIVNGIMIGCIVFGVFNMLIGIIDEGLLW